MYRKGSSLVFSLVVLSFLLISALSVAVVSVTEKRSALSSKNSNIAFQIGDSISETVLQRIYKVKDTGATIIDTPDALIAGSSCADGEITGSLNAGTYAMTLYKSNGSGGYDPISCSNSNWRSDVVKIKFQGTYQRTTRAIEVGIHPVSDMVGFWKLDDGTGSTAKDSSQNSLDLDVSHEKWDSFSVPTQVGGNLSFDGSATFAVRTASHIGRLDITGGNVTMCAWVYSTKGSAGLGSGELQGIMAKRDEALPTNPWAYGMNFNKTTFKVYTSGSSGDQGFDYKLPAKTWTYVCGVISKTDPTKLYIDGVLKGSAGPGGGVVSNTANFTLGASYDGGEYFDGALDEVRIFDRVLLAPEIAYFYNTEKSSSLCDAATFTPWCLNTNTRVTCDASGTKIYTDCLGGQTCSTVDGNCHDLCAPTTKQCLGSSIQTCSAGGTWVTTTTCSGSQICSGSNGTPACVDACVPNATQCSGNLYQVCSSTKEWGTPQACPGGQTCASSSGKCENVPHGNQTFTSSGSFTVPERVSSITIKAWGAGGGSGGSDAWSSGGSGGGGAYSTSTLDVTPGDSLPVVVGVAGGNGASNSTGSGGGSGGSGIYSGLNGGAGGNAGGYGASGAGGGGGGMSGILSNTGSVLFAAGGGAGGGGAGYNYPNSGGAGGAGGVSGTNAGGIGGSAGANASTLGMSGETSLNDGGGGGGGGGGKRGGIGGGFGSGDTGGGGGGGGTSSGTVVTNGSGSTPGNASDTIRGTAGNGATVSGGGGFILIGSSGGPDASYVWCANEGGTCSFSGTTTVAYGVYGQFAYQYNVSGSIFCDNSVFGDPYWGYSKACYYKNVSSGGGNTATNGLVYISW